MAESGEFFPNKDRRPPQQEKREELKPLDAYEHDDTLVKQMQLFREKTASKADSVYVVNPSGDISAKFAFEESRVIICEDDKDYTGRYPLTDVELHEDDPQRFNPGEVDIAIMNNSVLAPEEPARHVREGGYFLCNNYFQTADMMRKNGEYDLVCVVRDRDFGDIVYETDGLDTYLADVDTDDQLKKASYEPGKIHITMLPEIVEKFRKENGEEGSEEDLVATYKRMQEIAFERDAQTVKVHPSEDTQLGGIAGVMSEMGLLTYTFKDGEAITLLPLPKQKGTGSDMFVFQKKEKPQE